MDGVNVVNKSRREEGASVRGDANIGKFQADHIKKARATNIAMYLYYFKLNWLI